MGDSSATTRIVQSVGISTSLILAGSSAGFSVYLVPRLLESPTPLLLRQWDNAYEQGKRSIPSIAIIPLLSYAYLAYSEHTAAFPSTRKAKAYAAAALLTTSIVPYTLLCMRSINGKLKKKKAETSSLKTTDEVVEAGLGNETAHALLDHWGVLNLGRSVLLAASGVLGVWTALN